MSHTKEPWFVPVEPASIRGKVCAVIDGETWVLSDTNIHLVESPENARRVVACVNACAGISTEFIENVTPHQIKTLIGFAGDLDRAKKESDQLRELCGELLDALKNHRELTRPIHQSDFAITKAEKALGGSDGNS